MTPEFDRAIRYFYLALTAFALSLIAFVGVMAWKFLR